MHFSASRPNGAAAPARRAASSLAAACLRAAAVAATAALLPAGARAAAPGQPALEAGAYHSCALTDGGGLRCWGRNDNGQLGDGTVENRPSPVAVRGLPGPVVAVTAGDLHSCALTAAGAVLCWGDNEFGQIGDGTNTDRHRPTPVAGLEAGVRAISANHFHSCAVTGSGSARCWGRGEHAQLGDGWRSHRNRPVMPLGLRRGIVDIAAGGRHSCALTDTGRVMCWGWNEHGQVGDGTIVDWMQPTRVRRLGQATAITAGWAHNCAILAANGGLRCWGRNAAGGLGDGSIADRRLPVRVLRLGSGVAAVSAGGSHSCAVTAAGAAYCWGWGGHGNLGNGGWSSSPTRVPVRSLARGGAVAIQAGSAHSCALTDGGGLRCWGWGAHGQLGDGGLDNRALPVRVRGGDFGPR